ncbi:amidohydrolase family protein [Desulfoscipio gibsoniae]
MAAPKYFIDAHVHLMTPYRIRGGIKWIRRMVKEYEQLDLDISPGELLEQMKQAGADYFFNYFYPLQPGESREINRWQRELADRYTEIIPFASLHPGDEYKERIIDEALDGLKLKGFKFHPYIQNFDILDRRMLKIYEILQARGCPVNIHTGFARFYGKGSLTGDFLALLRNYPKMQIIAAHLLYDDLPYEEWPGIMEQYPNLYLDTTNTFFFCSPGSRDIDGVQRIIEKYSKRMLFGSDYPMGMAYPVRLLYEQVARVCPNQDTLEDVAWRTAAGLAGLDLT